MSEATEWVTVKVPEEIREQAREQKPESATWGDCLEAGAGALNQTAEPRDAQEDLDNAKELLKDLRKSAEVTEERTGRIERQVEQLEGGR